MNRETLKAELDYLVTDDDEMQQLANDNILEVYDVLEKQGHSGFSFSYVTGMIKRLIFDEGLIRPILPYEEDPEDWGDCSYGEKKHYQNKRRSSVFYEPDGNKYFDVDKCSVTDNGGKSWFTTGGWFRTFQQIKVPYKPDGKMWHIYTEPTVELEPGFGADDGDYIIKKVEYR